jgi:hypothetical protein
MEEALGEHADQTEETLADVTLDADDEPVLGPVGRALVIAMVVVLAIVFIGASVWLFGYLAYTTPPVPGGG